MECPACGGEMWDNRKKKMNPKSPDYKCKDVNCKFEKNKETGEYNIDSKYVTSVWEEKQKATPIVPMGNTLLSILEEILALLCAINSKLGQRKLEEPKKKAKKVVDEEPPMPDEPDEFIQ